MGSNGMGVKIKQVGLMMVKGPFGMAGWSQAVLMLLGLIFLTVLTQTGGLLLWPFCGLVCSLWVSRSRWSRWLLRVATLSLIYVLLSQSIVPLVANKTGRRPLPMMVTEDLPLGPRSLFFALLQRNYVRHSVYDKFTQAVHKAGQKDPELVVRYLDAGFPFPKPLLLPHLSHADGRKIDVAFQFKQAGKYVDQALSPIGYWGYAMESRKNKARLKLCEGKGKKILGLSIPLRWDFDWLQSLWPDLQLDVGKNKLLMNTLMADSGLKSLMIEPTLNHRFWGLSNQRTCCLNKSSPCQKQQPKICNNSCAVARHDDHFHLSYR